MREGQTERVSLQMRMTCRCLMLTRSRGDSAEMIAKRQVGRFRQVKSKTDACLLESRWWRDKGSVARDRAGGVVWGWLSKLARRAA
jgi:hypothetical protein